MSFKKPVHHLSQASNQRTGWVEGLTNLTEESPATALLDTMDRISKLDIEQAVHTGTQNLTPEERRIAKLSHVRRLMERQLEIYGEWLMDLGPPAWGRMLETSEQRDDVLQFLSKTAGSSFESLFLLQNVS